MNIGKSCGAGRTLICGSVAFDSILVFGDLFKNHIRPDLIHILNVSFYTPQMRREFGGCAGNIAYNLRLLGDTGVPMATVGKDFAPYAEWLRETGIPQDHLRVIEAEHTAQAFIITDRADNQITAFHPGAMQYSHVNNVGSVADIAVGIVSPDGRNGMLQHAEQFAAAGIPFIFDPGQGLPMFDKPELERFAAQARWIVVNEYEWQLLQEKTGWTSRDFLAQVETLIVTRGAAGSTIYRREGSIDIAGVAPLAVVDPTGCGDAYRAGVLHGLLHGIDWEATGCLASLLGAIKVESRGPQNHRFTPAALAQRLEQSFGAAIAKRAGF